MAVRTDANVLSFNPLDPGAGNTLITKGTSSLKTMKVTINGEQYFVQTRYDQGDGTTAAVAVAQTETVTKSGTGRKSRTTVRKTDTPWVIFTVNSKGETTFGGEGRTDNPDTLGDIGPMHITSEETAKAIAATFEIDGEPATLAEGVSEHNTRAKVLQKKSTRIFHTKDESRVVQGVAVKEAVIEETTPVPPVNIDESPNVDTDNGEEPSNNDVNADSITDAEGNTLATIGDKSKDVLQLIQEKLGQANALIKISPEDRAAFEKLFEEGGGDTIVGGNYPIDNTYGEFFGQDYVTIDQFIYQPPRRDQIFGENALQNITSGNQRVTPLKKFVAMVKLPMPNTITDANAVAWGDDVMNNLSAAITAGTMNNPVAVGAGGFLGSLIGQGQLGALAALAIAENKSSIEDIKNFNFAGAFGSGASGALMGKASLGAAILGIAGSNVSADDILQRGVGVVPNSNMELMFNAPALRDFNFSWKMSPRDEKEALEVKKIIRFFKQGMAAKTMTNQAGQRSLFLGTPNVFRLQYRTAKGEIIEGVNRIKPCAVVGTSVNYTPDGAWASYDGGQPVSTILSINMKELEAVYASDYSEKQILSERRSKDITDGTMGEDGDLYSISPNEVGY